MKTEYRLHRASVFIALSLTILACSSAEPNMNLSIDCHQVEYTVAEPLVITVTLSNTGSDIAALWVNYEPETQMAAYWFSWNGGAFERFRPSLINDPVGHRVTLAPGDQYVYQHVFSSLTRERSLVPFFDRPGSYKCYVSGGVWSGRGRVFDVISAEVSFEVVQPAAQDEAASELVREPVVLGSFGAMRASSDARDILSRLVEGESTYAPYAALALAGHDLSKLRAPGNHTDELRGLEPLDMVRVQREWADRALGHLDKADVDGFPLRAEAVRAKIEAHRFKSSLTKSGFLKYGRLRAETLALMQERYPELWTSEAEKLEKRLLTEFPDSAAAWRLRKELETAAPRSEPKANGK